MTYYGGINFEKWFDKVMTADSKDLPAIRKEFESIIKRQQETEEQLKEYGEVQSPIRRIDNEKKVHPQVIIQGDY